MQRTVVLPIGKSDPEPGVHATTTGARPPEVWAVNVTAVGLPSGDVICWLTGQVIDREAEGGGVTVGLVGEPPQPAASNTMASARARVVRSVKVNHSESTIARLIAASTCRCMSMTVRQLA